MKTIKSWNATILVDEFSFKSKPEIAQFIDSSEIQKIINAIHEPFYMVLGWDGTMLRAIQQTFKDNLPYLWINFWSKWFLLNERWFKINDWETFRAMRYPMLDIEVDTWNGKLHHTAFNEAQIKTAWGHMVDLNLQIWDLSKIRLKWDWLIIVTPAWSTGYNISAWWPVLPHTSPSFLATPLLIFEPRNIKPIVLENDKKIIITNNNERWYELSVYADATPVIEKTNKDITITIRKHPKSIKLLIAESNMPIWNAKIFKEQGFGSV
ncbi:MAG: Inorganic polyphosphate/ATP-NAD kinase [uncultured bacterium (gcode 4)]|uniref:Inorganic polyphosphate/ATP-NAD kinase n=1 Tax=uncultured bacterium (gcode 4) TaxID=1234023 RepID=K2G506_9BACT|nr:MAG: Inorganic polyphosphate/ATP-NAD kinase [uncultured bacterium (gcode 4)]